jgi:3-oxoacyl-[acyl-carrier protein] reductase
MGSILLEKTIIITGTARGMGRQMVETFAKEGANVFALARKDDKEHRDYCNKVADENQVKIIPIYFELTDYEAMKEAIKEIRSYKLNIDGLVNNAGITHNSLVQMTQMSDLRNVMETNFFAPYMLTQYVSKLMMRNKAGSIVNIASTAGLDGNAGKSAYGPSKAALITFTKCLAEELGGMGIRANVICPGVTDTGMLLHMHDYIYEIERNASALKKNAKPDDIAKVAVFLLSDLSSYVTGQVIRVDGGITTREKGV